jgi:hypothetical protein
LRGKNANENGKATAARGYSARICGRFAHEQTRHAFARTHNADLRIRRERLRAGRA